MEKSAREFLDLSGKLYDQNKKKWTKLVQGVGLKFDEDIYNDTIIKVYEHILNGEDTDGDVIGYWYKSFINNLKRNKQYSVNSKRDDIDVIDLLKDKSYIETNAELYYSTIRELLEKIKNNFDTKSYHLFKIYYMTDITFDDLSDVVGYDVKTKINNMRKWLKQNVQQDN